MYKYVFISNSHRQSLIIRAVLMLCAPVLWWFKSLYYIFIEFKLNGSRVRTEYNLSGSTQIISMIKLAYLKNSHPGYYYYLELFKRSGFEIGNDYLINNHILALWRYFDNQDRSNILRNKIRFDEYFRKYISQLPDLFFTIELGENNAIEIISNQDFFVKPAVGRSGENCFVVRCQVGDMYKIDRNDITMTQDELKKYLIDLELKDGILVQELLRNHQEMKSLSNGNITTIRINTFLNMDGEVSVLFCMLLMPTGGMTLSNANHEGIISSVDLQTGKLGIAINFNRPFEKIRVHPDGGGVIPGARLPDFDDAMEICRKAHNHLLEFPFIGWDIALTDKGPILLEGNLGWSIEAWELTHQESFDANRIKTLITYHLKNRIKSF
ncbi:hypothetical protein KAJ27_13215 [bacterium]|nr:hypothetical protein [bacterium]